MDTLELIEKYGISVRQIPFEVKETFRVEFNEKFAQGKDVQAKLDEDTFKNYDMILICTPTGVKKTQMMG